MSNRYSIFIPVAHLRIAEIIMQTMLLSSVLLTEMQPAHYPRVKEIYEQGIATRQATFETKAPEWEEWDAKHLPNCRLIALAEDGVVGWAALTPVSGRCVYRGVAEESVYIHPDFRGRGIGKLLLGKLVELSEQQGFWTLQAGIFKENEASVKLHEQCGFRIVGCREKLGQMYGEWRDVYLLERRSKTVGI